MLELRSLEKRISKFTLKAQFSVSEGERVALIGRSGGGKTSLLRLVAGLDRPDAGKIFLRRVDITTTPPEKREVGFVFQEEALFPHLNVYENLIYGLKVRRTPRYECQQRARDWLQKMQMSEFESRSVAKLSGGEKQRLSIARALIWRPKLILLDEPFSGLDAKTKIELQDDLLRMIEDLKIPTLLVTHQKEDVEKLATRIIVMKELQDERIFAD